MRIVFLFRHLRCRIRPMRAGGGAWKTLLLGHELIRQSSLSFLWAGNAGRKGPSCFVPPELRASAVGRLQALVPGPLNRFCWAVGDEIVFGSLRRRPRCGL
jgi:hypothetical protein